LFTVVEDHYVDYSHYFMYLIFGILDVLFIRLLTG